MVWRCVLPSVPLLVGLLAMMGCGPSEKPSAAPAAPTSTGPATSGSDGPGSKAEETKKEQAAPVPVDAEILAWDEMHRRLGSFQGRVVVVDFWSTACIPCMRELPHLFDLQRKHPRDLVAITVNIDYEGLSDDPPEACRKRALDRFLRKVDAAGRHWVSKTPSDEIYKKLDAGSIPVVWVLDRTGKKVATFGGTGELSYEKDVTPFVEKLLRQTASRTKK